MPAHKPKAKPAKAEKVRKEVFTVIDRGEDQKGFWVRIGTAFLNHDGSYNVLLDALPVNGKLNIRDPLPPREEE